MKIVTPWSKSLVEGLNAYQKEGMFHPYTCPGDKAGCSKNRELMATEDGWVCKCGEYKQNWAHG